MLETELKAILTKSQFDKIKEIFTWDSIKNQINSYYISPDNLLKKHGITLDDDADGIRNGGFGSTTK